MLQLQIYRDVVIAPSHGAHPLEGAVSSNRYCTYRIGRSEDFRTPELSQNTEQKRIHGPISLAVGDRGGFASNLSRGSLQFPSLESLRDRSRPVFYRSGCDSDVDLDGSRGRRSVQARFRKGIIIAQTGYWAGKLLLYFPDSLVVVPGRMPVDIQNEVAGKTILAIRGCR